MSNQTQKKIKKNKKIEEERLCAIETKLDILVDAVQALAAQSKVTLNKFLAEVIKRIFADLHAVKLTTQIIKEQNSNEDN